MRFLQVSARHSPKRRQRRVVRGWLVAIVAVVLLCGAWLVWSNNRQAPSVARDRSHSTKQAASPQATETPISQPAASDRNAALTSLLGNIVANKGDYAIAVNSIGSGLRGSKNGDKQYTSTSTYKLFVAYAVFKEVEAGRLSWSDTVDGQSATGCFDDMIRISKNSCVKAFGDRIGWSKIDTMMENLGLTSTQVVYGDQLTTANDLALFMSKLESGTLLSSVDKIRLISLMKVQVYRSGIPAGVGAGTEVADKVGFLDGLLHDAAIVYGPKGTYVVIILSNGSSWAALADAASQVHNFMSQ